jgi:hypothetical protein
MLSLNAQRAMDQACPQNRGTAVGGAGTDGREVVNAINASTSATTGAGPLIEQSGATSARPAGPKIGQVFLDTSLNKPIWYNGSHWIDATGTTV